MRKALLTVAVVAAVMSSVATAGAPRPRELTASYSYEQYLRDQGKPAPTSQRERHMRRELFQRRLHAAIAHNAKPGQTWLQGINHLSDHTDEELRRMRGGKATRKHEVADHPLLKATPMRKLTASASYTPPKSYDWRGHVPSVLTAVKDQGMCGSCWAHAATETIESHYALATGNLFTLSQQQLVSCAPNPDLCGGWGGCSGSIAELAYSYVAQSGGMTQEWNNPYVSYVGLSNGTCPAQITPYATVKGYTKVAANNQLAVMQALVEHGPLAVNVDASEWNTYGGGIYNGCSYARNISIDHVVQLVGFGYDDGLNMNYWIVRNSWSPTYGENGFIRVQRDADNSNPICGWNVDPHNGVACKGQTAPQWTCGMCGILFDTSFPNINN